MNAGDSEDSLGGAVCYKLRNSGGLFSVHSQKQDRDEGELTFRMMGSDDFADSLSPGIAGSTAGLPTGDSAGGSLPLKEVDAKSSALKALAGIGKVVSKSRRTDAEALLAIKAQRAKDRAEGKPFHRHSRTLSSGSMPLSDSSSATAHMPPSNRGGHRRSHSSIQLPSPSAGLVASVPLTSPYAYANWLAGRSLAELLALQEAVQKEITKKSNNSNIGGGKAVAFPPSSSSPGSGMSSHYSAALLAMLRDQPQRGDNTNPLQQSMNSATSNYAGTFDSIQGYLDPASCCSQSSGRGPVLSQQGSQYSSHTPLITGDSYGNSRSTSPYLETRRNVIPDASAASLSQLDPITPQTDPRDLIGLHLTSLSPGAGSLHSQQSSFSTTPEFSFLSDAPTFTSAAEGERTELQCGTFCALHAS